jgi:hypothetical protein
VVNEGREAKGYACRNGHTIALGSGNIESHGEENRNDCVNACHAYGRDHDRTSGSENGAFLVLGWESEISERLRYLQIKIGTWIERESVLTIHRLRSDWDSLAPSNSEYRPSPIETVKFF